MENLFWKIKSFHQLNVFELYGILRLRQEVFAVEQNCVYLDVDGKDQFGDHIFGVDDAGKVMAYCRILQAGSAYPEISIGRVATHPDTRNQGLGKLLMEKAINYIIDKQGAVPIRIEAQYYLEKFYTAFGFESSGSTYLLDGIEHIEMIREKHAVKVG
ncbi:MAG: GNAT family N-acetyltransferase [Chitinophagales bacterium]